MSGRRRLVAAVTGKSPVTTFALHRPGSSPPHAGRTRFGDLVQQWLATRTVEARTTERTVSMLRAHVLPKWGDWPLGKVDLRRYRHG